MTPYLDLGEEFTHLLLTTVEEFLEEDDNLILATEEISQRIVA
jgi:hypothetical protein